MLIYCSMDGKILTQLIADANLERVKSKGTLRLGQCMWNTFETYFYNNGTEEQKDEFQKLRCSDIDPFYIDENVSKFIEAVSKI